jgi:hypothetical protein
MPDPVRPEDLPRGKRRAARLRQMQAPPDVAAPGDLDPTPVPAPIAQPADAPKRRAARSRRQPAAPQAAPPSAPVTVVPREEPATAPTVSAIPAEAVLPAASGNPAAEVPEAPAIPVPEAPVLPLPEMAAEIGAAAPVVTVDEDVTAPVDTLVEAEADRVPASAPVGTVIEAKAVAVPVDTVIEAAVATVPSGLEPPVDAPPAPVPVAAEEVSQPALLIPESGPADADAPAQGLVRAPAAPETAGRPTWLEVPPERVGRLLTLFADEGARLVAMTVLPPDEAPPAADTPPAAVDLRYHFVLQQTPITVSTHTPVRGAPSATELFPAMIWRERELAGEYGLRFVAPPLGDEGDG